VTLREKQSLFVRLVGDLIVHATAEGYELTFGESWRTPEMVALYKVRGIGSGKSLHPDRLAIDLNLFVNGEYQAGTEAHRPLGLWWENLHPLCRWGGRFNDGNHYSLAHEGRA